MTTLAPSIPVQFFVPGIPIPKGSAKGFFNKRLNRVMIVQTNANKQAPWASIIATIASQQGCKFESGPVKLRCIFAMPRPKGHSNAKGILKPSSPVAHTKKPDLDKLLRCVKDALTEVLYSDDSQVCDVECKKFYSATPGAYITVAACQWDDVEIPA